MSAYVVITRDRVIDPSELEEYRRLAARAREGHSVTPLAFYGALHVLEGPAMEGAVILRFPTMEEARRWYESPEYQAALPHRKRGAEGRVFFIEGVDGGES